ncbi:MAG: ABC transporter substrate-binding protein, partial [Methylocystaceae bacterium]|nr:ABC transporter substrate-binding protein [Methylocystaceae bacterium]
VSLEMIGPYDTKTPEKYISGLPALFMIVADPVGAKLIHEYSHSGREFVTGTHNRVPEDVQIRAIKTYLKADRIGLAYNKDELNSVLNAKKIQELAGKLGFELVAKAVGVDENGKSDKNSLTQLVDSFKKEKVDIIYIGSSSFLSSNRDLFTEAALKQKIPVAAGSEIFVRKSKALLAVANRYYNIGQLAGLQAEQVLFKGKKPIDVEVRSLSRYSFVVNMDTARKLELYPPIQLLRFADLVNK